jgi:hypothetical protein
MRSPGTIQVLSFELISDQRAPITSPVLAAVKTLKNDETGEAFHVQQAAQIRAFRACRSGLSEIRTSQ